MKYIAFFCLIPFLSVSVSKADWPFDDSFMFEDEDFLARPATSDEDFLRNTKSSFDSVNWDNKYYKLGEKLANLLMKGYEAQENSQTDNLPKIQEKVIMLNDSKELIKLAHDLEEKDDIISRAKLATFIEGTCARLNIKNIHHLDDYIPLFEDVKQYTRSITYASESFPQVVSLYLKQAELRVLATLYEHALAL